MFVCIYVCAYVHLCVPVCWWCAFVRIYVFMYIMYMYLCVHAGVRAIVFPLTYSTFHSIADSTWRVTLCSEISLLNTVHVGFQGKSAIYCNLFCGINERVKGEANNEREEVFSFALPTLGHLNVFNFSRYTYKSLANLPVCIYLQFILLLLLSVVF